MAGSVNAALNSTSCQVQLIPVSMEAEKQGFIINYNKSLFFEIKLCRAL